MASRFLLCGVIVADYPVIVTLRFIVCALPVVGVDVMTTAEAPAGVTCVLPGTTALLPPQPEIPAANAPVNKIRSPNCRNLNCFFESFFFRPKAANPANPPGPQKASAGRIGFIGVGALEAASNVAGRLPGVCRIVGSTCKFAVATFVEIVSVTLTDPLPVMAIELMAVPPCVKEHFALAGNAPQLKLRPPVYPPVKVSVVVPVPPAAMVKEVGFAVIVYVGATVTSMVCEEANV